MISQLPMWVQAAGWGGFTGGALLIGAMAGYYLKLSQRVVAGIMAFGSGALISALSFELIAKAYSQGGLLSTASGFILGAIVYSLANLLISKYGARHRKRSNLIGRLDSGIIYDNALAIAAGAFIDGIPESIIIGLSIVQGGAISLVTVAAIFISNIPEGLSSSAGMKVSGKKISFVLAIWGGIAIASSIASGAGFLVFSGLSIAGISIFMAVSAGAMLAMIIDTMMPEAFEKTHNFAGLITVLGFLCAFILEKL